MPSLFAKRLCGAKRRDGGSCTQPAMANGRCRMHNGGAKHGIAASQFKHGLTSKYLPRRLQSKYEEARRDPELLSLRSDISLLAMRLGEVLQKLETGESREAWSVLATEWGRFRAELPGMGEVDRDASVARITQLIGYGLSETYVWNEARQLIRERASLVESERKRLVEMQQFISKEQAFVMIGAILAIIRRHVSDPVALAGISADIGALTASRPVVEAGA